MNQFSGSMFLCCKRMPKVQCVFSRPCPFYKVLLVVFCVLTGWSYMLYTGLPSLNTPSANSKQEIYAATVPGTYLPAAVPPSTEYGIPPMTENEIPPTTEYEIIRRRLTSDLNDMWDYLKTQLHDVSLHLSDDNLKKRVGETTALLAEHKDAILNNLKKLEKLDGYNQWRLKEHKDLGNLIQRRLKYLQNPKNCSTAKKAVCNFQHTYGWGMKLHHICESVMVAYGSGRTLVFNTTDGWIINGSQWETFYKPISENCMTVEKTSIADWPGTTNTPALNLLPMKLHPNPPPYWPQSIPRDISDRLVRLHGHPFVWLYGQFLKYILRPQPYLEKLIASKTKKLGFQNPIVGVQVRRTDKIKEAKYYNLSEYMEHVESFYRRLEMEDPNVTRRVYLATDEPNVLKEAQEKYPQYKFIFDVESIQAAGSDEIVRTTAGSLHGIILDLHFLSNSDYVVCTFSSNICRAVYEIKQAFAPDASNSVRSIDEDYYEVFQHPRLQEGIYSHQAMNNEEIDIVPGDVITFHQKYFNGFSKGTNQRTKKTGFYPSFKAIDKLDVADFETFPDVT